MNTDEMIKDKEQVARIIAFELCPQKYHKEWYGEEAKCYADNNFSDCIKIKEVVDKLYNEGYRKIADDEIVIKKSEYDILLKDYALTYDNAYRWGLKVSEEEVEYWKSRCDEIGDVASKEMVREIFQELYVEAMGNTNEVVELTAFEIEQLAKEKGIEVGEII